jgi:ABC-type Fe3+-hydroxamate transport system substrate-binding protein
LKRIVSLVPSLTELLADLGLDDEVVGLTRFCVRPPGWKDRKTIVGGTKKVAFDRVRDLEPDLVIANREENTREDIEAIAELAPVHLTDISTLTEGLAEIKAIGEITGRAERADEMVAEIERRFDALPAFEPVRAAYLIWTRPWMSVGGDTFIHDLMRRAGLINVFGDRTRYPEVDLAEIGTAGADVVLLSTEPYPFDETHVASFQNGLPGLRAALVDGEMFSWYGSRLLHAPAYIEELRRTMDAVA